MRRILFALLFLAISLSTLAVNTRSQEKSATPPAASASAVVPAGARGEFLNELAYYEQRFTRLAEAVPAEKYSWRPADGVRTVGDVYEHVIVANYAVARALGTPLPPGIDLKTLAAIASDKAKVVPGLKDSFAHLRSAILAIKDSDLDNPQKMFGQQTTVRGAFLLVTGNMGEHLGQSIAYARQNGVVPPWTAERQKQEAEKPKE